MHWEWGIARGAGGLGLGHGASKVAFLFCNICVAAFSRDRTSGWFAAALLCEIVVQETKAVENMISAWGQALCRWRFLHQSPIHIVQEQLDLNQIHSSDCRDHLSYVMLACDFFTMFSRKISCQPD